MSKGNPDILFDKFEIIDCLKKDDFTAVYLANHIYLSKKIILKLLDTNSLSDATIIERFKREAKILAQLDHPNIIKVLDFGMHGNFFYISFEYFPGKNLRSYLKKNNWTEEEKKQLSVQLLRGLAFAHSNKVIHRDIKPENIFVDENLNLKIGDFGLAFSVGDNFVTSKSAVIGTPSYMSPEQIQGDQLTEQSDLFSTGIVLFELYTGYNPFAGDDVNHAINSIINFNFSDLLPELNKLPEEIAELLKGLVQKKKRDRIENASAALELLGDTGEIISSHVTKKNISKVLAIFAWTIAGAVVIVFGIYFAMSNGDDVLPTGGKSAVIEQDDSSSKHEAADINEFNDESKPEIDQSNEPVTKRDFDVKSAENENDLVSVKNEMEYGSLKIECLPWAEVYLDSVFIDTTPIEEEIILKSGRHKITLRNPGYPEHTQEVFVLPDSALRVKVNLDTLISYMNVQVFPWGEIFLGEKLMGQTPFPEPLKIFPGKHNFRISNPDFKTFEHEIIAKRNDTLKIYYNFMTSNIKIE